MQIQSAESGLPGGEEMKLRDRLSTVFIQLFVSYASLLLLTTIIVGVTSHLYFTKRYNAELESMHDRMLSHTNELLENGVLAKAEQIYYDLTHNADAMYLFDHPLEGNHAKLIDVRDTFQNTLRLYPDIVDSLFIYYRDRGLIVSSQHGVAYLNTAEGKRTVPIDWIERMERDNLRSLWMETRKIPANVQMPTVGTEAVSYVRASPYAKKEGQADGYIAVNLKASVIRSLISAGKSSDEGQELIVDAHGAVIAAEGAAADAGLQHSGPLRQAISERADAQGKGSFTFADAGKTYFVSFATVPSTGWKLIQATPVNQFYKQSYAIQRNLLLLCLGAVAVGLVFALRWSRSMYSPVKRLLQSVRGQFSPALQQADQKGNEFKQLDRMVSTLSGKMHELEAAVQENRPLIKHNLVTGLLYRTIQTQTQLQDRMQVLSLNWSGASHCVLALRLEERKMNELGPEQRQIVIHNLIRELERLPLPDATCLAVSSDCFLYAVVSTVREKEEIAAQAAAMLSGYARGAFGVGTISGIGRRVKDPLQLHLSLDDAKTYIRYRYLHPEQTVFAHMEYESRERNTAELPERLLEDFAVALKCRNEPSVRASVERFAAEAAQGAHSVSRCLDGCRAMLDLYGKFAEETNACPDGMSRNDIAARFERLDSIKEFGEFLTELSAEALTALQERGISKGADIADKVKAFIESNLDNELSLQAAADHVSLNASYLSQLFKEETGHNYVEYVTERRIRAAARLITATDLKIEEIARRVGYNSPAYFIKKFKQLYGITPGTFKTDAASNPRTAHEFRSVAGEGGAR
ncbi:helix-turn-helix domain-containing protein [Paenibacillus hemerocallicola]|uniref:Helix-turn-helix domain-containing protein n=2 Tax=Paenibacillus hemerocallicola TaxID=1172614 RepID=A0A5C4SXW0_9BACL|nr:helix-turn-helix domain-containing protein [Paenibacillus hemerocallicola]